MATSGAFFTEPQADLVTQVLDRIIPPDERMPGAGEIAVGYLDEAVGRSPGLRRLFGHGLALVQVRARQSHGGDFNGLSADEKDAVLREVESAEPGFFDALVRHTYNGYYTNGKVVELLGLEARPPQPRGHQVELGDLSLIEKVKQRGIVFREA